MKKLLIIMLAVASVASADIFVNVFTDYGFEANDGGVALNSDESARIDLLYVGANGAIDAVTGAGGGAFGDDVLLGTFNFTNNGGTFDADAYFTSGEIQSADSSVTGASDYNVFGRIYQSSSAAVNTWYYEGSIAATPNVTLGTTPAPISTGYQIDVGGTATAFNQQVIPEPATIGLLGIAGAGLFAARRKTQA